MTVPGSGPVLGDPVLRERSSRPARADQVLAELPPGTVELAAASLGRGLVAAGHSVRSPTWLYEAAEGHLLSPLIVETDWPRPSAPLPVADGAVHADLTDDDHEVFARLRLTLAEQSGVIDAEMLAAAAQTWRLAVTPYRRSILRAAGIQPPTPANPEKHRVGPARTDRGSPDHDPAGPGRSHRRFSRRHGGSGTSLVIDLSALWAGPLATSLLAELGARVVKVDADVRPDGLRHHPGLYRHLNGSKDVIDLDLRAENDRRHFESLLADADLVVDSFSPRVMPNFGYGPDQLRARFPHLASLSIVAFPPNRPERDWVSYGPGVHAISGLGATPDKSGFRAAPIAYPDALAGLRAFAVAAEMLTRTTGRDRAVVSLAEAVAPLVTRAASHNGPGPGLGSSKAGR